jgi:Zn-dependent protease with chaperone function
MSYENPDVPHEVNVGREDSLVELVRLLAAVALCVLAAAALLFFAGGWLARLLPFSIERSLLDDSVFAIPLEPADTPESVAVERYLQTLADELAMDMQLAPAIDVTLHYTELDVPNAFATLGGHIVVTSELYRRMPSENALAMVLAHEIAHVQARDPIAALGGSASVALVLALLSGEPDRLVPGVAAVVQLGYSRDAETRADDAALAALIAHYGHAGGAASVFRALAASDGSSSIPPFLSTHPADAARIARLEAAAVGWNQAARPLVPLVAPSSSRAANWPVDRDGADRSSSKDLTADLPGWIGRGVHVCVDDARVDRRNELVELARVDSLGGRADHAFGRDRSFDDDVRHAGRCACGAGVGRRAAEPDTDAAARMVLTKVQMRLRHRPRQAGEPQLVVDRLARFIDLRPKEADAIGGNSAPGRNDFRKARKMRSDALDSPLFALAVCTHRRHRDQRRYDRRARGSFQYSMLHRSFPRVTRAELGARLRR